MSETAQAAAPAKKKTAAKKAAPKKAAPAPAARKPVPAKRAPIKRKASVWAYMYGSSANFDETVDEWTLSNKEFSSRAAALEDAQGNQDAKVVRIVKSYGTYRCEQTTKLVRK